MAYKAKPLAQRFWARVDKNAPDGHWLWLGKPDLRGQGRLGYADGGQVLAHRFSAELAWGEFDEALWVRHTCGVQLCVNPEHLSLAEPHKR